MRGEGAGQAVREAIADLVWHALASGLHAELETGEAVVSLERASGCHEKALGLWHQPGKGMWQRGQRAETAVEKEQRLEAGGQPRIVVEQAGHVAEGGATQVGEGQTCQPTQSPALQIVR